MPTFVPSDAGFAARVHESFARQTLMQTIGARLVRVEPGEVEIHMRFRDDLAQQHGFLHAGIVTALVDTACGYAAYTLMPADAAVLSVELKINFLAPALGDRLCAVGFVKRPGRTLTVCAGDVVACNGERKTLVATMLATMTALRRGAALVEGDAPVLTDRGVSSSRGAMTKPSARRGGGVPFPPGGEGRGSRG